MNEWILTEDGTLCHHGILGQKWGVKNGPPYPLDSAQKSKAERKFITKKEAYKQSKTMSDEELRKTNNRLQAERQYRQLVEDENKASSSYVENFLEKHGDALVTAIATATITYVAQDLYKGKLLKKIV